MKKRLFVLAAALVMVAGIASFALSGGATCSGKVTKIEGDKVTIDFSVGDSVVVKKKEGVEGAGEEEEFLMGC
jgi:hypothetical protein